MQRACLLTLTMLATGCATSEERPPPTNGDAMCYELEQPARDHAGALAEDGGDRSVDTGRDLIAGLAAACGWEAGAGK